MTFHNRHRPRGRPTRREDAGAGPALAPGRRTRTQALQRRRSSRRDRQARGDSATGTAAPRTVGRDLLDGAPRPTRAQVASWSGAPETRGGAVAEAERGVAGPAAAYPHRGRIEAAFGRPLTARAHVGPRAAAASEAVGAEAYALGNDVAFRSSQPDLHTAAHEAVHTLQQQSGVMPAGGVGRAGDPYERQADAIAARVVAGQSAGADLASLAAGPPGRALQRQEALLPNDRERNQRRYAASSAGREEFEDGGYSYWNAEMDRQERIGNRWAIENYSEKVAEMRIDADLPQPLPSRLGAPNYYEERHGDFMRRHPDGLAPRYYLQYGLKYAIRFTTALFDELSDEGKRWLLRARTNLQLAFENMILRSPADFDALEQDDEALQRFAFDSHPQAYLDAGLRQLPITDLVRIGLTPDLDDTLSMDGLSQIGAIAPEIARHYRDKVGQPIRDALRDLTRWFTDPQLHGLPGTR
jgi:hypothetical protein